MKVLVTGGAGFIGSHVAEAYLAAGHQVFILDNLSTGRQENLPEGVEFFEADITDQNKVHKIITTIKPSVINHHAAHIQVGNSVNNPQFDAQVNIIGVLNIMQAAKEVGVEKVIMASTGGAMYGNKQTPFTEEMKEEPVSPYGVAKRSGELYLNYYHEQYGIPYIALRYANVYGPRQNPHGESGVVAIFMDMIKQGKKPIINGSGSHTRDYVFVTDVAKANLLALDTSFVGALNIGTGVEITTTQVFQTIVNAMQAEMSAEHGPERPGEQVTSALSAAKAKKILDWQPSIDFPTGVQKVADWYAVR